jgi:putative endopeptidase
MRLFFSLLAVLLLLTVAGSAQSQPGVNLDTIDKTVDPCVDFYQYACGNWLKTTEIPSDQTSWNTFVDIRERNAGVMREILERAAAGGPARDAITQKIGDYYGSCIDESAANTHGVDPLKPELKRIENVKDKAGLIEAVARVQMIGPNPLFIHRPTCIVPTTSSLTLTRAVCRYPTVTITSKTIPRWRPRARAWWSMRRSSSR